jgi:hypothetical protein
MANGDCMARSTAVDAVQVIDEHRLKLFALSTAEMACRQDWQRAGLWGYRRAMR